MYSSASDVVQSTGVKPVDLGLDTDEQLTALLDGWLNEASDIIDRDRRRDFSAEYGGATNAPPLVHSCARRMVGNMVALAILRRETPIIRVDDFSIKMVEDKVLTEAIRRDLALIPRGRRGASPLRLWRVRSSQEVEESDV